MRDTSAIFARVLAAKYGPNAAQAAGAREMSCYRLLAVYRGKPAPDAKEIKLAKYHRRGGSSKIKRVICCYIEIAYNNLYPHNK